VTVVGWFARCNVRPTSRQYPNRLPVNDAWVLGPGAERVALGVDVRLVARWSGSTGSRNGRVRASSGQELSGVVVGLDAASRRRVSAPVQYASYLASHDSNARSITSALIM
jgi:hypothetical protein